MIKAEKIEKLPEEWERVRFKDYVYFQEEPGLTSDLFEGKEEGIPCLNIRCIQENRILAYFGHIRTPIPVTFGQCFVIIRTPCRVIKLTATL
ncbi:MAG: hypothetical protein PWP04_705 [Candidatus Atribacteria bacterium]|nr:hypothetical protein [Candidatus Atribacteria bacterium]